MVAQSVIVGRLVESSTYVKQLHVTCLGTVAEQRCASMVRSAALLLTCSSLFFSACKNPPALKKWQGPAAEVPRQQIIELQ